MSKETVILNLPLAILLLPLLSAALILLFFSQYKRLSAGLSVGTVGFSLAASIFLFVSLGEDHSKSDRGQRLPRM